MRLTAFLALLCGFGATTAAAAQEPHVFIGGVASGLAHLADPALVKQLRASGKIGLYQHPNGMDALKPEQRSAVWSAWGLNQLGLGTTDGATVGEVGSPGPNFLAYAAGHVPEEVDANAATTGRSRYTAVAGDAHPGREYGGYTSAADLADMKKEVDFYRAHGARTVAVVVSPNQGDADLDDPFPTGVYWANIRAIATYGGAIALDTPPNYAFGRGQAYLANAAEMIAWGNAHGLRTSVIVSPWAARNDAHGHIPGCGFDTDLSAGTKRYVEFLRLRNALPKQWVVENYCPDGTPNDVDPAGGPDSLNAVALYLATLPHP